MLNPSIEALLDTIKNAHLTRERFVVENNCLNFSSNDYLGLSKHPQVISAFANAATIYGLGSGSSAVVSGYLKPHQLLEEKFADFLGRDSAILFNSGYHANLGILQALLTRHSSIIYDKLSHASLIDGVQLSRAKAYRYRHQDFQHAETLLTHAASPTTLLSESVFSMEGNITFVPTLCNLAKQYHANLIIDDAHGIGVLGQTGKGVCEHFNLTQDDIPCLITPLGKAMGSMGAIISGKQELIEALLQLSRTYRYTTALPPAIAMATVALLDVLQQENWRLKQLRELIQFFISTATSYGLKLISSDETPIKPILIEDIEKARHIQTLARKENILISCIRPPTVPVGTTRLRISINVEHTKEQISQLLSIIAEAIYD